MENEKNLDSFYEFFNAHYENQHQESVRRMVSIKMGVPELGRRMPELEVNIYNQMRIRQFYFSGKVRLVSFYKLGNKNPLNPDAAFDVNYPYFDYPGWDRIFLNKAGNHV